MQIDYFFDPTPVPCGYQDDQGSELFTCDFAIIDRDQTLNGHLYILDDWQAVFTLETQEEEIKENEENAKKIIDKVKQYIDIYKLLLKKISLDEKISLCANGESSDLLDHFKKTLIQVENDLTKHEKYYKTLLNALTYNEVGLNEINDQWVAENMINDRIYQNLNDEFLALT